jgi:hypothetical protein
MQRLESQRLLEGIQRASVISQLAAGYAQVVPDIRIGRIQINRFLKIRARFLYLVLVEIDQACVVIRGRIGWILLDGLLKGLKRLIQISVPLESDPIGKVVVMHPFS